MGIKLSTSGRNRSRPWALLLGGLALAVVGALTGYLIWERRRGAGGRFQRVRLYWQDPGAHEDWAIEGGVRCGDAPFLLPTSGVVGFLWGDSFRPGHRHQGLDIFGPTGPDGLGETPVYAAYDGYLTRESDWRSAVIIRHPQDPQDRSRQIWSYYAHMADPEGNSFIVDSYAAGTREKFVRAGTLLGYQGNYSGDEDNPTGMHLHFSLVLDDGEGGFRSELDIGNTLDPSPYLGIPANAEHSEEGFPVCGA